MTNTISDIIFSNDITLPNKFLNSKYDRFLFFDISLTSTREFLMELEFHLKENEIFTVYLYTVNTRNPILTIDLRFDSLIMLDEYNLTTECAYDGLVISIEPHSFIIGQSQPYEWGVLSINSSDKKALSIFEHISKDWFLSMDDFIAASKNKRPDLLNEFGIDFINELIRNYSV